MENTMMNSQSAAAVNSANVRLRYNDIRNNGGNYKWQIEKINIITAFFDAEFFSEEGLGEYASVEIIINGDEVFPVIYVDGKRFSPISNKHFKSTSHSIKGMIAEMENMAKDVAICVGDCENKYYPIAYPYMPWIENYVAERDIKHLWAAFNETPVVDQTPMLEEDDDITEEGYSVAGLAYAKENTSGVSMADIIRAVAEEHWNFESVVKESQWTRFTNDSFRDLIWSTCWAEYLVGHTDEALEAETRYIMDFDSVYDDLFGDLWPYMSTYDDSCGGCELWVNAWDVVERAAEIIEGSGNRWIDWDEFPNYVMDAFLGNLYGFDTFTERVMSELEGGDIIGIMPYDDGLHLSFVDDEAEVSA